MSTKINMTPEEFEEWRKRNNMPKEATGSNLYINGRLAREIRVDKSRHVVKTKPKVFLQPTKTEIFKSYNHTPGGRRLLCLDLSTKCIGMAWGEAGQKPEGTCSYPRGIDDATEAQRLLSFAKIVVWEAQHHRCGFVIFGEFYANRNMMALRANSSLRGAVMAALAEVEIEALPVAEITCRKAAGVDITKRKPEEPKQGWMKERVHKFFDQQGMEWPGDDEADAAVLLMGANAVVEIG